MSVLIQNVLLDNKKVDVYIEGNTFKKISPSINIKAEEVINAEGQAIFPSFFNVHTHAAMTLLRGYADDMELHTWLTQHIWPFEQVLTPEDVYWGTKLACLEMIKTGTTFFCDMYWHIKEVASAVDEMGMRAALSSAYVDFNDPKKGEHFRKRNMEFFHNPPCVSSRIKFIMGPHAIYTVSKESLIWIRDFAREHSLMINIHLAETRKEKEDCIRIRGCTPVRYLKEIGLLDKNLLCAHVIWVDEEEIEMLGDFGVKVAHVPTSNMKLCSGPFRFNDFIEKGIVLGIGTDGCASNNNLDMLEEMKIAALRAKMAEDDPTVATAPQIFKCATISGAQIFDIKAGKIEEGWIADCILVDLEHPQMVPSHNSISNLVYSANGDVVTTCICDGKIIMKERKVPGEVEIIQQAKKTVNNILARL